ncbi:MULTISPECIES: hypothetical protein [Pontibacillus]|uniref:Lipoprotein n=1 Tax=Pontibacillus chungwhensis TaxID=265426 RepID=A0ABY8UWH1_9BACI|nr:MULTISPECIES: hypothetical protein [Pontibacillus]MCD5324168.1 hypothetical protein [Pontibacillus sp. HN14]WIF97773.1 hypothetical protein QNI29_18925 [Pontibacillus chungwhensis]
MRVLNLLLGVLFLVLVGCNNMNPESEKAGTQNKTESIKAKELSDDTPSTTNPVLASNVKLYKEVQKALTFSDDDIEPPEDYITVLAWEYDPAEEELQQYEEYIIDEYISGRFDDHLKDREYLLTNIFVGEVLYTQYRDFDDGKRKDRLGTIGGQFASIANSFFGGHPPNGENYEHEIKELNYQFGKLDFSNQQSGSIEAKDIVDQQMKKLKTFRANEFEIEVAQFYITGKAIPEILEIRTEKVPFLEEAQVQVSIYQYQPEVNEWRVSLEEIFTEMEAKPSLLSSGKVMGDKREQLVIGKNTGSGGYLSFFVIGSKDKRNIEMLLDLYDSSFHQGTTSFAENELVIRENDELSQVYVWDNNVFRQKKVMETKNDLIIGEWSRGEGKNGVYVFKSNGKVEFNSDLTQFVGSYTQTGDEIIMTLPDNSKLVAKINGEYLSIYSGSGNGEGLQFVKIGAGD